MAPKARKCNSDSRVRATAGSQERRGIPPGDKPSDYCQNVDCRDQRGEKRKRKQTGYGKYCATCCHIFDPETAAKAKEKKTAARTKCIVCITKEGKKKDPEGRWYCDSCWAARGAAECSYCAQSVAADADRVCSFVPECGRAVRMCSPCVERVGQPMCLACWGSQWSSSCLECKGVLPSTRTYKGRYCAACFNRLFCQDGLGTLCFYCKTSAGVATRSCTHADGCRRQT